jgi:hypothetical protein
MRAGTPAVHAASCAIGPEVFEVVKGAEVHGFITDVIAGGRAVRCFPGLSDPGHPARSCGSHPGHLVGCAESPWTMSANAVWALPCLFSARTDVHVIASAINALTAVVPARMIPIKETAA